jgi:antitoxin YefM
MQAILLKDAERNLSRLVEQVLADAEPRIVVTDQGGQVVVMPLDDFNSWKETLYLLAHPANAAHLRRTIAEAEAGKKEEKQKGSGVVFGNDSRPGPDSFSGSDRRHTLNIFSLLLAAQGRSAMFHTFTVPSLPDVAKRAPSGLNATLCTAAV